MYFNFSILLFFLVSCGPLFAAEDGLIFELSEIKNDLSQNEESVQLAEILEKSLDTYESMNGYRAIFYKTERSDAGLGEKEKIFLKFEKPWKIFMGWLNTEKKGLQVVYERGKNNGKLAIHKPGLLWGLAPVIFLDQNSPWIRQGSASYDIEDAGIGTFLYDFTKAVIRAAREKKLKIIFDRTPASATSEGKSVDVTFLESNENSGYFAYRVKVKFHKESHLPVAMELIDWQNRTIGIYEYEELSINVGEDFEFMRQINRQLLKIYESKPAAPASKSPQTQNFAKAQRS